MKLGLLGLGMLNYTLSQSERKSAGNWVFYNHLTTKSSIRERGRRRLYIIIVKTKVEWRTSERRRLLMFAGEESIIWITEDFRYHSNGMYLWNRQKYTLRLYLWSIPVSYNHRNHISPDSDRPMPTISANRSSCHVISIDSAMWQIIIT